MNTKNIFFSLGSEYKAYANYDKWEKLMKFGMLSHAICLVFLTFPISKTILWLMLAVELLFWVAKVATLRVVKFNHTDTSTLKRSFYTASEGCLSFVIIGRIVGILISSPPSLPSLYPTLIAIAFIVFYYFMLRVGTLFN